jgi:glycosyltransferase involved in cell wall biosynthesis
MDVKGTLRILGTRGVPACHGGFETFAEQLALHLVTRGWRVIVYCQSDGHGALVEDTWNGVERVIIPIDVSGSKGTMLFDWLAIRHAARHRDLCLTLGYNTAVFCAWLRLKGVRNIINMDGIEWRRAKWSTAAKIWFWLNDWAGCWLGNHLVADHPGIARHLGTRVERRKITTIPYGAPRVRNEADDPLRPYGLASGGYVTVIARAEPENSILEIVRGFSQRRRGVRLVVLGKYDPTYAYHAAVKAAASDEVLFLGAIYDKTVLHALRCHSLAYLHGHRVGGTNPSLVEALGAGNAVLAHDNAFNRWVAGDGARYFRDAESLGEILDHLLAHPAEIDCMKAASVQRFADGLTLERVMKQYEELLWRWLPVRGAEPQRAGAPPREAATLDADPVGAGLTKSE